MTIESKLKKILDEISEQRASAMITSQDIKNALSISDAYKSVIIDRLVKKKYLVQIRKGLYFYIPLGQDKAILRDEYFNFLPEICDPFYIGGVTALNYWGMTEQIFNEIFVITPVLASKIRFNPEVHIPYKFFSINQKKIFGLKKIWHGSTQIDYSDLHKTIVDILDRPVLGGGINQVRDVLHTFLMHDGFDAEKLKAYIHQQGNRVIYKRLGYLMTSLHSNKHDLIEYCLANISKGYSKIDSDFDTLKLCTKWRLWVPERWKNDS